MTAEGPARRRGRGKSAESLALIDAAPAVVSELPAEAVTIVVLTREDARILTDRIKHAAEHLYQLLLEAHEGKAWLALGYPSWREYAAIECSMSQSYAYRLLNQARVLRALEQAAGSPIGEIVSEHVARQIKPSLRFVTSEITERIQQGEEATAAVQTAIHTLTEKPEPAARRVVGPPSNGLDFARCAIMQLEEIRDDDTQRQQAFDAIRTWLDAKDTGLAPGEEYEERFEVDSAVLQAVHAIRRIAASWPDDVHFQPLIRKLRYEADRLAQWQERRRA